MKEFRTYIEEKKAPKMEKPTASGFDHNQDLFDFIAQNLLQSLDAKKVRTSDMYYRRQNTQYITVYSGADKATIRKGDLRQFDGINSLNDVEKALKAVGIKFSKDGKIQD